MDGWTQVRRQWRKKKVKAAAVAVAVVGVGGGVAVKESCGCATPVFPDTTAPVVSVTAPTASSTITGTISVTATATDAIGVVGVQFKVDGVNLGAEDTVAPYATTLNTTSYTNASHIISAVARDAAANTSTSTISVTVFNTVSGTANLWIDSDGGTCVRNSTPISYNDANACNGIPAAYTASQSGDAVLVRGGNYGDQTVLRGSHSQTGAAVSFTCETGQTCNIANGFLRLGNSTSTGGGSPNNLIFDGINVADGAVVLFPGGTTDPAPANITYKNAHIWCMTATSAGTPIGATCDTHLFYVLGGDNVLVQNVELGPMCCSGDLSNVFPPTSAWPVPKDITFDNIYMHDNYDTCLNFPAALTSQGYVCNKLGFGDLPTSRSAVSGAIDATQTSITVNNVVNFPASAVPFPVTVDNEHMNVTGISGSGPSYTWIVARGVSAGNCLNGSTTLNGAIDATQTSIVVASANGFPNVPFNIKINTEILTVTTKAGTTWTVTRAAEGTTGATHINGATVTQASQSHANTAVIALCDPGYDHVDGFQLEGSNNLTIKNSRIYALNIGRNVAQGMFGEGVGNIWSGVTTIQNTAISSFGTCGLCFDGSGSSNYTGTINFLYDTFANFRFDMGDLANGATVNIFGTIFASGLSNGNGGSGWGCTWTPGSGSVTVNMDYNMLPAGKTLCGAHDITGPPTFVGSSGGNTPDMRLTANGQAAIHGGETGGHCPPTDAFGGPRTGVCDLGFHQPSG